MRISRKLLSILLALVMAVSLLPAAMAAEGEAPTAEIGRASCRERV